MATKNGNLPKKSPKLRQIHPKPRKFKSCHLDHPKMHAPHSKSLCGAFFIAKNHFAYAYKNPLMKLSSSGDFLLCFIALGHLLNHRKLRPVRSENKS